MAIRLYADECVDARIVRGSRRRGVDVVTAADESLLGVADEQHLARATELSRTVLTNDHDFLALAVAWIESGLRFPGIIFILPGARVGDAVRGVTLLAMVLDPSEIANAIEWVP
jgi:hypothetical protein